MTITLPPLKSQNKLMQRIIQELKSLKPHDGINGVKTLSNGYQFIDTYGHGYLFVPRNDKHYQEAESLCQYGYRGALGVYLEEDSEAPAFVAMLNGDRTKMEKYLAHVNNF